MNLIIINMIQLTFLVDLGLCDPHHFCNFKKRFQAFLVSFSVSRYFIAFQNQIAKLSYAGGSF